MRSSPLAEDASGVYVSPSGLNAPALSAITEKPQINCLPVMSGLTSLDLLEIFLQGRKLKRLAQVLSRYQKRALGDTTVKKF